MTAPKQQMEKWRQRPAMALAIAFANGHFKDKCHKLRLSTAAIGNFTRNG